MSGDATRWCLQRCLGRQAAHSGVWWLVVGQAGRYRPQMFHYVNVSVWCPAAGNIEPITGQTHTLEAWPWLCWWGASRLFKWLWLQTVLCHGVSVNARLRVGWPGTGDLSVQVCRHARGCVGVYDHHGNVVFDDALNISVMVRNIVSVKRQHWLHTDETMQEATLTIF